VWRIIFRRSSYDLRDARRDCYTASQQKQKKHGGSTCHSIATSESDLPENQIPAAVFKGWPYFPRRALVRLIIPVQCAGLARVRGYVGAVGGRALKPTAIFSSPARRPDYPSTWWRLLPAARARARVSRKSQPADPGFGALIGWGGDTPAILPRPLVGLDFQNIGGRLGDGEEKISKCLKLQPIADIGDHDRCAPRSAHTDALPQVTLTPYRTPRQDRARVT